MASSTTSRGRSVEARDQLGVALGGVGHGEDRAVPAGRTSSLALETSMPTA